MDVWRAWTPTELALLAFFLWCLLLLALTGARALQPGWAGCDFAMLAAIITLHWLLPAIRRRGGNRVGFPVRGLFAGEALRHGFAIFIALPLAYKESGSFGTQLMPLLENRLITWDRVLFGVNWLTRRPPGDGALATLLEGAYLSNYLLLLLTFILALALPLWRYRAQARRHLDAAGAGAAAALDLRAICGSLVLALLLCYAVFPLFPAITPRLYFPNLHRVGPNPLQGLNWELLSRFSIPYGIFPSGHVAGATAVGSLLAAKKWRGWAAFFLLAALLIAVATVYGDYHFVCDAAAGFGAGALGWWLAEGLQRRYAPAAAWEPGVAPELSEAPGD